MDEHLTRTERNGMKDIYYYFKFIFVTTRESVFWLTNLLNV